MPLLPPEDPRPASTTQGPTPTPPRSSGGGFPFQHVGGIVQRILSAFRPPSTAEVLQERILRAQLTQLLAPAGVPYAAAPWPLDLRERQDYIVLGPRGSGKTATAVTIAATMAEQTGLPAFGVDWPSNVPTCGIEPLATDWTLKRDAIVILDEASLRTSGARKDAAVFRALALARHRNLRTIWTTQTGTAMLKDVFRMEPTTIWCGATPLSGRFERDELIDLHAKAATLGFAHGWPTEKDIRVCYALGQWAVTRIPLHPLWTERLSKLWR